MNELDDLLTSISDFLGYLSPLGADFDLTTLVSIQGQFNAFLTALYTYIANASFPNVNYLTYDQQFYQLTLTDIFTTSPTTGIFWKSIPHKPTVYYSNGKLNFRQSFEQQIDIKGSQIQDNIVGSKLSALLPVSWSPPNLKLVDVPSTLGIIPYYNASRYTTGKFSYYANNKFNPVTVNEFFGSIRVRNRKTEVKNFTQWQGFDIPRRDDEVYTLTDIPIASGDIRAKLDNSGLEVYRSGAWIDLLTF